MKAMTNRNGREMRNMVNLAAELAQHLELYNRYYQSRTSVEVPQKIDAPMVQDLYLDTEKPLGIDMTEKNKADTPSDQVQQTENPIVTYRSPIPGDLDFLGLINDRLKTQARRYPHPITNEMEELG